MRDLLDKMKAISEAGEEDIPQRKPRPKQTTKVKALLHKLGSHNPIYQELANLPVRRAVDRDAKSVSHKYGSYRAGGKEMVYLMFETLDGVWGLIHTVLKSGKVYEASGSEQDVKSALVSARESMAVKAPEPKNQSGGFFGETQSREMWDSAFVELKNFFKDRYSDAEIAHFLDGNGGAKFASEVEIHGSAKTALDKNVREISKSLDDASSEHKQSERDRLIF